MKKKILISLIIIFFIVDSLLITYKIIQDDNKQRKAIHKKKTNYKYSVYLTSDDGPLEGSKNLNQLVLDYEFPLTIFLVGKPLSQDKNLEEALKAYKNNPYITIGNHSFTHANFHYKKFYKNPIIVEKDFLKNEKFLNIKSKIGRFPGRNIWTIDNIIKGEKDGFKSAKILANKDKYSFFGWDYEIRYKKDKLPTNTAIQNYKRIKELLKSNQTFAKNQIVVLMHDQMFSKKESQKMLSKLIFLLENDNEIKLKNLKDFKMELSNITISRAKQRNINLRF